MKINLYLKDIESSVAWSRQQNQSSKCSTGIQLFRREMYAGEAALGHIFTTLITYAVSDHKSPTGPIICSPLPVEHLPVHRLSGIWVFFEFFIQFQTFLSPQCIKRT